MKLKCYLQEVGQGNITNMGILVLAPLLTFARYNTSNLLSKSINS